MWKAAYLTILLIATTTVSLAHAEPAIINDGVVARSAWQAELRKLFDQGKYAELENIAQAIRKNKEKFPEGMPKISYFYDAFNKPTTKNNESWLQLLTRVETWRKAFPKSITPRVAEASVWDNYAWDARGEGFSNTVTDKGWSLFQERLEKAHNLLKKTPQSKSDDCPGRHWLLLKPAYSSNRKDFEQKFRNAIAFDPSYMGFYQSKAFYLLPRWHGSPGDSIRFADEAVRLTPKKQGMIVYARIMWQLWSSQEISTFREPGVSWEKVKQGFLDLEKQYPNSRWNLNWFCKFACHADDKKTARILMQRIGNNPYIEVWGRQSNFEIYRRYALSD